MQETRRSRAEAGVLTPEELTTEQRRVLDDAVGFLVTATTSANAEGHTNERRRGPEWRFMPAIEQMRHNQVFLIDGKRGSGKSTVLMTLLHVLRETLLGSNPADYRVAVETKHAIVPAGLVDLQPIDPQTNLLLHLVGQLSPLVEVLHEQLAPGRPTTSDAMWSESADPACVTAWRSFVRAATAAWDAQLSQRKPHLDLEELAVEVELAERRRLQLPQAFASFVDALARDYASWRRLPDGALPLFVIAIDDADMNPHKARELLDLLRTLWHERIAFVLTGHSALFLDTLEGELRATRGLDEPGRRVTNAQLARNIYDKIVPEPHRLGLPELSRRDRKAVLGRILDTRPDTDDAVARLLALIDVDAAVAEAIPGRLREIRDLGMALAPHRDSVPRLLQAWMRFATRSEAERALPFRFWLEPGPRLHIGNRALAWRIEARQRQRMSNPLGHMDVLLGAELRFEHTGRRGAPEADELPCLHVVALAALAQLADHAVQVAVSATSELEPWWVQVHLRQFDITLPWRLPAWETWQRAYAATQRFCEFAHSQQAQRRQGLAAMFAYAYVALVRSSYEPGPVSLALTEGGERPWSGLAEQLKVLLAADSPPEYAEWARWYAPYLAAPESGLPAPVANRWLDAYLSAMSAHVERDAFIDELRGMRSEWLDEPEVERWLDENFTRHKMFKIAAEAEVTAELKQALSSIQLPVLEGVSPRSVNYGTVAKTLDAILARRQRLAMAPIQIQNQLTSVLQPYKRLGGTSVSAIQQAWSLLCTRYPEHARALKLDNDSSGIKLPLRIRIREERRHRLELENGLSLTLIRAGYPAIENLHEDAPPELDALTRILFDAIVDSRDTIENDQMGVGFPGSWPFMILTDSSDSWRLPAPEWRALFDWEIMFKRWNQVLDKLLAIDLVSDPAMPRRVYQGLLFWYLNNMPRMYEVRGLPLQLSLDVDWDDLGRHLGPHIARTFGSNLQPPLVDARNRLHHRLINNRRRDRHQQVLTEIANLRGEIRDLERTDPKNHRTRAFQDWCWRIWELANYLDSEKHKLPDLEADLIFKHTLNHVMNSLSARRA